MFRWRATTLAATISAGLCVTSAAGASTATSGAMRPITITTPSASAASGGPNCGKGVRVRKVIATYTMKRDIPGNHYRPAHLYCGDRYYGYRHLEGHIGEYFGGWGNFNFSIGQTLRYPQHNYYQPSRHTYLHSTPIDQCFYSGQITHWTFYVITSPNSTADIITAYGRRGSTVSGYCPPG